MNTSRRLNAYHVSSRAQRLDRRQESLCALALVMLMGLATVSVMATTTHTLSNHAAASTVSGLK